MRVRKNKRTNIWPAGKFCRLLASAGMLLLVSAATGRAQAKDGTDLVPVSMSAGETYVINDIKPGTKPSFNIAQNPNAFVSYDSPAGKLTILAAEAGHWIVTVTNTSDHVVSYDFNSLAAAKPGAPLTPGTAPPPVNEPGLESRPGAGASTSTPAAMPELATISSSPSSSSPAAPYSADVAAKTSSSFDASSTVPPQPGKGVQAYEPSQTVGPLSRTPASIETIPRCWIQLRATLVRLSPEESTICRRTPYRSWWTPPR